MHVRPLLCVLLLAVSGCAWVPWSPFGTPLTAERKAEARVTIAEDKAGVALVEMAHKTKDAVEAAVAGKPEALTVAQSYARTTVTLANQIFGAPTVESTERWRKLIEQQTSMDAEVRTIANAEARRRLSQVAKLSAELDDKNKALDQSQQLALRYAAEKEAVANTLLKVCWGIGAVILFFVVARILAFASQFYPGLAGSSRLLNGAAAKLLPASFRRS